MQSHLVAAVAEFVGTFFFLYLAYAGHITMLAQAPAAAAAGGGNSSETVVYISLVYSMALLVNAWAFYRVSGGLFNPAVGILVVLLLLLLPLLLGCLVGREADWRV